MINMEEEEADASRSAQTNDYSGGSVSLKPPEDVCSDSPVPPDTQDLRSVLVTSVLNLEKLDVDLYR